MLLTFPVLAILAGLAQIGPFVPVATVIGAVIIGRAIGNPRFGLTCTVVLGLLIPVPLAFGLGPFHLTFARIVGYAFIAGWIGALSRKDGPLPRRTSLDWAFALLLFSYLLSLTVNSPSLAAIDFRPALQATSVTGIDQIVFFYAAVSILAAGGRHRDRVLQITALVIAAIAVAGIFEWLTGNNIFNLLGPLFPNGFRAQLNAISKAAGDQQQRGAFHRARATFEGPNQFGAAVVLALPLLLHYWSTTKRQIFGLGALVCTFAAITTISRSAFIGLVVVMLVYFAASGTVQLNRVRVIGVALVLVIAAAANPSLRATLVFYFKDVTGGQQRTVQGRLSDYENVGHQFVKTPVAGSGPGTWRPEALKRPFNTKVQDPDDRAQQVLDNVFLSTLAERGAIGLFGLLAVLLGAIGIAVRGVRRARAPADRSLRAALLAGMILYAVLCAFFDMLSFAGPTTLYFVLVAAVVVEAGATRVVLPRKQRQAVAA